MDIVWIILLVALVAYVAKQEGRQQGYMEGRASKDREEP